MTKTLARNLFYWLLIFNIVAIWYFSYTDHPSLNIENIQEFLTGQNLFIWLWIYLVLMVLRGLTLFPGTPFLILWAIIFPTHYAIFTIALAVQLYVILIYKYSEILNFRLPEQIQSFEKKIEKYGIFYIMLICLIPGMSLNILAYFLSVMKVSLQTIMVGIWIGSLISLSLYLYIFKILFDFSI